MMTAEHPNLPGLSGATGAAALERDSGRILDVLGQGVCLCRADGTIEWGNRVFQSFPKGLQRRVAVGCRRVASRFLAAQEDDPLRWRRRHVKISLGSSPRLYYNVIVAPLAAAQTDTQHVGETRFVAAVSDISAQEQMRRKVESINAVGSELLHIEPDTIRKLSAHDRLATLERHVSAAAKRVLSFDHFAIRLINGKSNRLDLVMSAGLPRKATEMELYASDQGQGISGVVAATGKAYICPDTTKDPLYVFGLENPGSSLTVPLRAFDSVVGVFNIEADRIGAFSESDRQFAEIFGHYVAMALHFLQLLVVERSLTREVATDTVRGELSEPLNDLATEAEHLKSEVVDPAVAAHVEKMLADVESIRRRVSHVSTGPQVLLGVEDEMAREGVNPVLEGRRVLVVDNEKGIRQTINDVLTRRGCRVTTCESGSSAIKLLKQWQLCHDADEAFDLVVSDINLDDHTGYDIFAAARAAREDLPVILMTGFGYDPHHSIVRATQEGLRRVLSKPFLAEALVQEAVEALQPKSG